ncbi:RNA-directed DNA polymerase, eukaryota, reverse transcriptase zinc-binding domain protein, partial [Tanacetum coccineum]
KSLTKVIESSLLSKHSLGSHHKWNSWIHRKVNVMVWKASLNRLAMRLNLAARGVALVSTNCRFCDSDTEDIEHVLIRCPRVSMVWRKVWCWWNLPSPISFPSFSVLDIAKGNINGHGDDIDSINYEDFFSGIQRMAKIWMSARIKSKLKMDWNSWVARPFDLFL